MTSDKVKNLQHKAEYGEIEAMFELANCYNSGDGIEQDYKKADSVK